jgi:cysteinyl-tRNA synthetase
MKIMAKLTLYNTLTRKKQAFTPLSPKRVGLYTCGPTVYNYAHIGNLRAYVFEDILKRVLMADGYKVKHVMNITDVGHLTDDADQGEDKMEKGARREGKTAWDVAAFFTGAFQRDVTALNVVEPTVWCKATDHIKEQIAMVKKLTRDGHTYETSDGIYFDTTSIKDYGKLAQLKKQSLKAGSRVDMGEKKNPHDFALWKFSPSGEKRQMEWEAFGHKGFPGWHIECSAMSIKYLGKQFDIHCGGIDHVSVHHTNEIAQSEAFTGKKPWVKFWLHGEFLLMGSDKMAKSGDNFVTLKTLQEKGISPLAYRYFLLQSHYRKQLSFSWEALQAAQNGLEHLYDTLAHIGGPASKPNSTYEKKFFAAVNDDLNCPEAVALLWEVLKSSTPDGTKLGTAFLFDEVLGLNLETEWKRRTSSTPETVEKLVAAREKARTNKNWAESDRLRDEIKSSGYTVEDTPAGQKVIKL